MQIPRINHPLNCEDKDRENIEYTVLYKIGYMFTKPNVNKTNNEKETITII